MAKTAPIVLSMEPVPSGCTCPVCGQALSYESPGRYVCDICESAYAQRKTIEDVRADVEDLAKGMTARLATEPCSCGAGDGVATGQFPDGGGVNIHFDVEHEPGCPRGVHIEWPPIDDDYRRWQDGNAPSRRDHFVAELQRLIRLADTRPFRGHIKAGRALKQIARQHLLTDRAKRGSGPRKRSDRGLG